MLKKRKKMVLIIVILMIVIGAGSVAAVKASRGKDQGIPVNTMVIEKGEIVVKVPANGVLEEVERQMIFGEATGKVKEVRVRVGDKVTQGEVLAILDTIDLRSKLEIAQIQLEMDKINLAKLKQGQEDSSANRNRMIEASQRAVEEAREVLERNEALFKNGAIAKLDYDRVLKAYEDAKRNYEDAQNNGDQLMYFDIETMEKKMQVSQLNVEEIRREMEKQSGFIISPMGGIVTAVNLQVGSPVNPTNPSFIVSNIENLEIKINVSEYDIAKVKVGQEVEIETDALHGKVFKGRVGEIAPVASRYAAGQSTETVVPVTIQVVEPDEMLKPGFSVKTRIVTEKKEDTIVVPFDVIIVEQNGAKVVFKVSNGQAERVEVQTGIESDFSIEIIKGLEVGDEIILSPSLTLKDGTKIQLKNQEDGK